MMYITLASANLMPNSLYFSLEQTRSSPLWFLGGILGLAALAWLLRHQSSQTAETRLGLHIPDGFLSTPVAIVGWLVAVLLIGQALRRTRDQLGERQIPLLGIMAAFIFAAQSINFPVAGGTSGHLLGGALAAIVLGPWSAVLVMTAVIALQGLLFQDGGLLVMGWNIVNMGILTAFTGHLVYWLGKRWLGDKPSTLIVAGVVAAWLSVVVGAWATAIQLAISGTVPLHIAWPAMTGVHALIGIGEALITVGALTLIARARPDLLVASAKQSDAGSTAWVTGGLVLALAVAAFSFAASSSPDGLERVAEDQGFLAKGLEPVYNIFPDYTLPFVSDATFSGILAVMLGTVVVFAIAMVIGRTLSRQRSA
jgi:cobalt/nickel transport system permease protein